MIEPRIHSLFYPTDEPRYFSEDQDGGEVSVRPTLAWDEAVLEGAADGPALQFEVDGVGTFQVSGDELLNALSVLGAQRSGMGALSIDALRTQLRDPSPEE